jgi:hypothetical protein
VRDVGVEPDAFSRAARIVFDRHMTEDGWTLPPDDPVEGQDGPAFWDEVEALADTLGAGSDPDPR